MYSSREHDIEDIDLNAELDFTDIKKLSDEESEKLEGTISLKEASQTLFKMKSNKSPGSDGFTSDFLKVFEKKNLVLLFFDRLIMHIPQKIFQ